MLASLDIPTSTDLDSVRPGVALGLGEAFHCIGYQQGSADAWFASSVLLGMVAGISFFDGERKAASMLLGGCLGAMWNAYSAARSV